MSSLYEMTSVTRLNAAADALAQLGYNSEQVPAPAASVGPWLAVYHDPDRLAEVSAAVYYEDPAAVHQR